jgi:hypothetical protein
MPVAAVTLYVKSLLDGLPMPGPNALAMQAFITPPDPNTETQMATAYIWPTDGHETRNPQQGGAIPRNTGPGTAAGWKPISHMIDVFIDWFQADDDPQADSIFPGIVDAVMFALRTSTDSVTLTDPYNPNVTSTLYNLGEDISYQTVISSLADQAYDRYQALLRCPCVELIQA